MTAVFSVYLRNVGVKPSIGLYHNLGQRVELNDIREGFGVRTRRVLRVR